jgi:hypothetical protein
MDLHNPNIPDEDINSISEMLDSPYKEFNTPEFIKLYEADDLGASIKDPRMWLYNHFQQLLFIGTPLIIVGCIRYTLI